MLRTHGIRRALLARFAVDALGDLHLFDLDRRDADCLMNRNRSADADGDTALVIALECENLSEAPYIHPLFARSLCIGLFLLDPLGRSRRTITQAFEAVVAAVLRLYENRIAHVLHPVPELPLNAHVRDLTHAVIIRPGTVAVQWVSVSVCVRYRDQCHKIDLILQCCHVLFLLCMICCVVFGEKGISLQLIAHEIQILQLPVQLVLRESTQNVDNFPHKLFIASDLPCIDAIEIRALQLTVDPLKHGERPSSELTHKFDGICLPVFVCLCVVVHLRTFHHSQQPAILEAAVICVQFPSHFITSLFCVIPIFLENSTGCMHDFSPVQNIIGQRGRRPLRQCFQNIQWEDPTVHFAVQQSLQVLTLDAIVCFQKVISLGTKSTIHELKQIRSLYSVIPC